MREARMAVAAGVTPGRQTAGRMTAGGWRRGRLALAGAFAILALGCGMIDQYTGVKTACELKGVGVAAQADILAVWETGIRVNDEPVIGLKVRVLADDRPPFEAEIPRALISFLSVPQFQPGKQVPVVFDPKNPTKIGLDIYRCH